MNNNRKYILITVGHTAAGKTTLSKYLAEELCIPYVSEGLIKRNLVKEYSSENSLDESLRDNGYKKAIGKTVEILLEETAVILDASFHKLSRRLWVYESLKKIENLSYVWLDCNCPNVSEVKKRILARESDKNKTADNQADRFYVYEHIMSNFDTVRLSDFPLSTAIISIDTEKNVVIKIQKSSGFDNLIVTNLKERILPNYFRFVSTR
jgi:adenylate kinase family enzyme